MRIGVIFPQTELGGDVGAVRAYAAGVDGLGYAHLSAPDHVVGADPAVYQDWAGPYDVYTTFHEPFVLYGFIAALTSLELVTGVIILPQRQTVLVAKQAAELDLLTNGRFRLGIGIGWNPVEYDALGKNFSDRGARCEDQVALLRRLWTEQSVTYETAHERVTGAGLAPLPLQRPIPIWFGADSPPAHRRIGRLGDGWLPQMSPGPEFDAAKAIVDDAARAAGRDPAGIGIDGRVSWGSGGLDAALADIEAWEGAGASHVSINTMGAGFASVDEHLAVLGELAGTLGLRAPGPVDD